MNNIENNISDKQEWVKPEMKNLNISSTEAGATSAPTEGHTAFTISYTLS